MSKRPSFDPEVLALNKPSQSLKPLDFLQPMAEEKPAPPLVSGPETSPAPKEQPPATTAEHVAAQPARPDDPRYLPAPKGDDTVLKSFRIAKHTNAQLKAEAYFTGADEQAVINEAIAEWFKKRYGSQGRK